MTNVTIETKKGPVALCSIMTGTLFPGRTRVFHTGVKVDSLEGLGHHTHEALLPLVRAVELEFCPNGGLLVVLMNDGDVPVLIEEGMEIASVWAKSAPKAPVLTPDALNDIIKSTWDHSDPSPVVEVLVAKDSEMGKAIMEALEETAAEDEGMTETFKFVPVDDDLDPDSGE